jgi:hypothetical protein
MASHAAVRRVPSSAGRGSIRFESILLRNMADHIRYDLLTQQALRGVVRTVLTDAAKKGLTGDHHFYISFNTQADGVRLSQRLREQYPEEMTIILQHQFWDLSVNDDIFEVGLSFGGVPERLTVPFDAINGFFDPSVQFGLQFEPVGEGQDNAAPVSGDEAKQPPPKKKAEMRQDTKQEPRKQPARSSVPAVGPANPEPPEPPKPASGAEVVRLDRFRKK